MIIVSVARLDWSQNIIGWTGNTLIVGGANGTHPSEELVANYVPLFYNPVSIGCRGFITALLKTFSRSDANMGVDR